MRRENAALAFIIGVSVVFLMALTGDQILQNVYDSANTALRVNLVTGGSGGTVTGSGANTQVAYWTSASAITGNAAFTFTSATGSLGATRAQLTQVAPPNTIIDLPNAFLTTTHYALYDSPSTGPNETQFLRIIGKENLSQLWLAGISPLTTPGGSAALSVITPNASTGAIEGDLDLDSVGASGTNTAPPYDTPNSSLIINFSGTGGLSLVSDPGPVLVWTSAGTLANTWTFSAAGHLTSVGAGRNLTSSGILTMGSGSGTAVTDSAGKVLSAALNTVAVANGGTGLTSGTSGGILAYTASGTLASSGALTANVLTKGGGAGVVPTNSSITDNGTTVSTAEAVATSNTITSSRTTDLGWSVVAGANTACNTTCTSACVVGFAADVTGSNPVACTDATADTCLCAGAS